MKKLLKKYINPDESIRLAMFNILSMTMFVGVIIGIIIMVAHQYGFKQISSILGCLLLLILSFYIANNMKKLNLAAGILVIFGTMILFPRMFFDGGAIFSGMPIYYVLGTIFLFMLVQGKAFYILLVIQLGIYAISFCIAYYRPSMVTPLGTRKDMYTDILQSIIIVGAAVGVINKFQTMLYESVLKKLNEQNKMLQESEKRADMANQSKSEFISNMSHEIRTPINAIIGMNEMIRRESEDKEISGYANIVNGSARSLLAIINDLLDISKIEAGKMEIVNSEYDLMTLIADSYYMVKDRAENKGLQLIVKCDESLPKSYIGDLIRVRQVIINLLTNSVKYTDVGVVTLNISGQRSDDNMILKVSVIDTGIGMREVDMENLFKKFERLDLVHNQSIEGTGLGLNIVKELVTLMGGEISVQSEYGSGSTFTITIPQLISDDSPVGKIDLKNWAHNAPDNVYTPTLVAPDAKVLVVDDVELNLTVFKSLIKETKIQVDTAISGHECLNMITEKKYDVIFLDHMMPIMNGIETFERMKLDKTHMNVDTPVIMLTANAIIGKDKEYEEAGFNNYLTKPIESAKLEEILRTYILQEDTDNDNQVKSHVNKEISEMSKAELLAKGIDIDTGIMNCGGEKDFYLEIVDEFERDEKRAELLTAYANKDWQLYSIAVHSIKGILRMIGASEVGDLAEKLQFASEKGEADVIEANHDTLVAQTEEVIRLIKSLD